MEQVSLIKSTICLLYSLFFAFQLFAQHVPHKFCGSYSDQSLGGVSAITTLELRPDGTFRLRTIDPIYPQTFKTYENEGTWMAKGKDIILNPELKKRENSVSIVEKTINLQDSIEIKINHYVALYENQELINKKIADFELLTLYFDKPKKNINLLRARYIRKCAWAPRIKNQVVIDSTNTFRIPKKEFKKIGIYTYGLTEAIEATIPNPKSNCFEINVIVAIDKERMPRAKKVIIKGKRAYFYEIKGKVNTLWLDPLIKKAD